MYYCCPFKEKYLVEKIEVSHEKNTLIKCYGFFKSGDLEKAYVELDHLLHKKDDLALILSSMFSMPGEDEESFYQRHLESLILAAENGNSIALYSIGVYLDKGEYFEEDKQKAYECFKSSAELNMPQAMYIYGVMQYYGTGGAERNKEEGLGNLIKASKEGVIEANEFLDSLNYPR